MKSERPLPPGLTKAVLERMTKNEFAIIVAAYGLDQICERCEFSLDLMEQIRKLVASV